MTHPGIPVPARRRTLVGVHTPAPTRTGWTPPRGPFPHSPAPSRPEGLAAFYRRRDPTATPPYPLVQHHLESFLAAAAAADPDGEGIPRWVENDFRAYLRCGILAHGFARIRWDACAAERLVAFSCKGRHVEERSTTRPRGDAAIRQVLYHSARATPGGRTVLVLSPLEFLAAVSRLITPPRVHHHRNHGVLAPRYPPEVGRGCANASSPSDATMAECRLTPTRGMFGFALWDSRQRRLMLPRDRLGIKPLHYAIENVPHRPYRPRAVRPSTTSASMPTPASTSTRRPHTT